MILSTATLPVIERDFIASGKPDHIYFDQELRGFGVRFRNNKQRPLWVVQFWHRDGSQRRITLGSVELFDGDEARWIARRLLTRARLEDEKEAFRQRHPRTPLAGSVVCPECSSHFQRKHSGQRFCTPRCQKRDEARRYANRKKLAQQPILSAPASVEPHAGLRQEIAALREMVIGRLGVEAVAAALTPDDTDATCPVCFVRFRRSRRDRVYCSTKCQNRAAAKRREARLAAAAAVSTDERLRPGQYQPSPNGSATGAPRADAPIDAE